MKLNGSDTKTSVLFPNQMRVTVFSMVKANTKRRRGSSNMIWCILQQIFFTSWSEPRKGQHDLIEAEYGTHISSTLASIPQLKFGWSD